MVLILTVLFALTQLGDWYTTRVALALGGWEANPVARFFMKYIGIDGYLLVKVVVATLIVFFIVAPFSHEAAIALIAFYTWAVYNNFNVIRKL